MEMYRYQRVVYVVRWASQSMGATDGHTTRYSDFVRFGHPVLSRISWPLRHDCLGHQTRKVMRDACG